MSQCQSTELAATKARGIDAAGGDGSGMRGCFPGKAMPEPAEQQCHRLEPSSKMLVPRANPKREHKHALVLFFHSQNLSVQRGDPVAKGSGFAPLFLFFTPKAWGTWEFRSF